MGLARDLYRNTIHFVAHYFKGLNFEVAKRGAMRPLRNVNAKPVSDMELEDMVTMLLATAAVSGKTITISQKGVPEYGMGGYAYKVETRPTYSEVRKVMDILQARREGREEPFAKPESTPAPQTLRCVDIPWPGLPLELGGVLPTDPANWPHHKLVAMLREYDRRLMQMWDKVNFEGKHGLVDYSSIGKELNRAYAEQSSEIKGVHFKHAQPVWKLAQQLGMSDDELFAVLEKLGIQPISTLTILSQDDVKAILERIANRGASA